MVIIIQYILVRWTKKSRGAEGGALRNALPESMPLYEVPEINSFPSLIEHEVQFMEREGFEPIQKVSLRPTHARKIENYPCVKVSLKKDQSLTAQYTYDPIDGGAPRRSEYPRQVLHLEPGQWGRVQYNGRKVTLFRNSDWWYHKRILNIALVDKAVRYPFQGEPDAAFSDMAHLW